MYNSVKPSREDLPTSAQLMRSTLIALCAAAVLLVTVVLPAEYGIDPTGIGQTLKLTEMGAIKQKLTEEAAADKAKSTAAVESNAGEPGTIAPQPDPVAASPAAPSAAPVAAPIASAPASAPQAPALKTRKDEMSLMLKPGQGAEIKMQMKQGAKANYFWSIAGGVVNFDEHGDGANDNAVSYEKGKGVANKTGTLEAAFDGIHGWFWRNRGTADVTLTLKTDGAYSAIQRME